MNNHTGTNHNQKENKIATVNTDTNSLNTRKRLFVTIVVSKLKIKYIKDAL